MNDDRAKERAMRTCQDENSKERGLALLVVLWIVASAALLVSAFNATVRSGTVFMASEVELTKAQAHLDAGLEIAAAKLIDEEKKTRWQADGIAHHISFAGRDLTIVIDDPNGRIDLNKTSDEVLLGLFSQFTESNLKAKRLRDLIVRVRGKRSGKNDKGDPLKQSKKSGKAAPPNSNTSKSTKPAAKLAFLDVTELRRMEGLPYDLYQKIAPYLTVYSRDGLINPMSAPDKVLTSIPKLTSIDIARFRASQEDSIADEKKLPSSLKRGASYLSVKPGPAYIVSVKVSKAGTKFALAKQFVIATGLDQNAPYRLISTRPLSLSN